MVHKLKPLRGRKWYETATMMFYCPALVATACVYFELFSPLTVIGWAVLFGAGPLERYEFSRVQPALMK